MFQPCGAAEFAGCRRVLLEGFFRCQVERHVLRRQVDQPGLRVERHRVPVVRAVRAGDRVIGFVAARRRYLDRPSIGAVAGRPVHVDEILCRDELAVGAVDHEEEAVLRRVQDDLARRAVDIDVGKDHRLGRGVVPVIARRLLIMPDIFAGVGVQRDDRGEIEVVAAGRAADLAIPRRAVAGADIDHVEVRIVGDGVPWRAAAAVEPVFA